MTKIPFSLALMVIIFLEGYVVLSSELLAIRLTLPFIGSGTDTVSVIIAAVLMPLAFGYQAGGKFKPVIIGGKRFGVRDKLIFNILVASVFLLIGLSYPILAVFFSIMTEMGFSHRLLMVSLYSVLFIVTPVYLLGQTIPLCSHYFSKHRLSQATGKILFFSTMGSFMGAVFSTLVLMSLLGVNYTVMLNFIILTALVLMLSKHKMSEKVIFSFAVLGSAIYINSPMMMDHLHVVENNMYNTIAVYEDDDGARHLVQNNSFSSKYGDDGSKHEYVEFLEDVLIAPIMEARTPKDFLIIGAGAFTFGFREAKHNYDYIDIDKSLRTVSEEYILKDKLQENQHFFPVEARAYLAGTKKQYDAILLDAYLGDKTIPEYLVTREFFQQVRDHLKPGGVVAANFIISPNFSSTFSHKIDNTFRSVFPTVARHVMGERYDVWNEDFNKIDNVIYLYKDFPKISTPGIYTDNKNTIFYDKPQKR